jgi:DNA-binding transcriptional LysR family regulator
MRPLTDLRKLRHVVGVARAGSFTTASNNLAISQSALTKSVAEVERLIGEKLFQRLPRGVTLTAMGALFVPRAERLLADTQELMMELGARQTLAAGSLRIGVAPFGFIGFLEQPLPAFAKLYPGIKIEVEEGEVEAIAYAVVQGKLDIVLGLQRNLEQWTELEVTPYATLNQFYISRIDHPLALVKNPKPQELMQYPLVVPKPGFTTQVQITNGYVAAGLTPRCPHYTVNHLALIERLVSVTDAIAHLATLSKPGKNLHKEFRVYPDNTSSEPQVLAFAHPKANVITKPAAAFIEIFEGFRFEEE